MSPARSIGVLVIGAGQAGLAAGYWLRTRGVDHLIVERAERIGDSWRNRWDSLTLFTPAAYSALPGLPLAGDPEAYPTKDAMADYLETYARLLGRDRSTRPNRVRDRQRPVTKQLPQFRSRRSRGQWSAAAWKKYRLAVDDEPPRCRAASCRR